MIRSNFGYGSCSKVVISVTACSRVTRNASLIDSISDRSGCTGYFFEIAFHRSEIRSHQGKKCEPSKLEIAVPILSLASLDLGTGSRSIGSIPEWIFTFPSLSFRAASELWRNFRSHAFQHRECILILSTIFSIPYFIMSLSQFSDRDRRYTVKPQT